MNDERHERGTGGDAGPAETILEAEPETRPPAGDTVPRVRPGVRGRGTRRRSPHLPCLNCGDATAGEHCPTCGQRKVEVLVSVREMVTSLLEDELILDRRLPRTLLSLLVRPGFLTVEYVNGRIARYIRPLKLYIVSSVIFFLLLSFLSLRMLAKAEFGSGAALAASGADTLSVAALDEAITGIDSALGDPALSGVAAEGLELTRRLLREQRERAVSDSLAAIEEVPPTAAPPPVVDQPRTVADLLQLQDRADSRLPFSTGVDAVDSAVVRRVHELGRMTPKAAIERLVGDTLGYIPTMMFVLLPMFALVLKLLYVRRRRFYAEHFVFLLHVHSFVYLIFTLMLLTRGVFSQPAWLMALLFGWTTIYIYIAMLRVYGQGLVKTFVKYWMLGWTYFLILALSVPIAMLLAFLLV